jgi:hypothetical protein
MVGVVCKDASFTRRDTQWSSSELTKRIVWITGTTALAPLSSRRTVLEMFVAIANVLGRE